MSGNYRSILNVQGSAFSNTKSILLDGVDDYVDLGASSTVADGGQFSFSFWIKGGSQSSNRYLFSADYYNQHTLWVVSGTSFQWMNLNAVKSNLSIDVLDNNWHHILIIWNPNGANTTIRCFTDGANEVNVPTDWRFGTGGIYKGALQYIGNRGGGSYNGFIGNLDEFAIWDDDQSANVSAIYNSGQVHDLNALSSPPVNWWRCGDGDTAPTLTDNGSGGNNGTMTNFSTFSSDVPTLPSFANTKSILLDGVDDEVSMPFTSTSTTGSISVWIKPTDYTTGIQIVWLYVGSGYRDLITLSQRTDGTLAVSATDSGSTRWRVETDNAVVSNGTWTHVVFSFDGSNGTIYINGSTVPQTYTVTTNTSWWWDDLIPTVQRLGILRVNGYSAQQRYNGNIEEQSVFTSALSATEVSAIYNNGIPTDLSSESNILAWYRMGDGDTAPTLTDNIGSNNGTMSNFSTFSTDVPT